MDSIEWTSQEDEILQFFSQNKEKMSWDQVSLRLSEELGLPKKSGKQCQQRYQQLMINDSASKIDWSQQQETILIQKHRQMGNKWAAISQFLNGKNDNCVKNHFYSRLRKMIRKLNRIVQIYFKKAFRTIPNATIYKLVEASQERFKQKPICTEQVSIACQDVISKMLKISVLQELRTGDSLHVERGCLDQYQILIQQINKANKNYKKKSKKIKNSTIKAPVRRTKGSKTKKALILMEQQYIADQSSSQSEKQGQIFQKHDNQKQKFENDIVEQQKGSQIPIIATVGKKVQIKQGDEMQELLKNIGLLHEGKKVKKIGDQKSQRGNHSIKSYSDFQNPSQDLSFFDDSNNCWKKESRMFSRINKNLFGDNSSEIEGL